MVSELQIISKRARTRILYTPRPDSPSKGTEENPVWFSNQLKFGATFTAHLRVLYNIL